MMNACVSAANAIATKRSCAVAAVRAMRNNDLRIVGGLTREQAYVLVSVAVDLRLSEIVDVPNPLVSALLPLDIFEA